MDAGDDLSALLDVLNARPGTTAFEAAICSAGLDNFVTVTR